MSIFRFAYYLHIDPETRERLDCDVVAALEVLLEKVIDVKGNPNSDSEDQIMKIVEDAKRRRKWGK